MVVVVVVLLAAAAAALDDDEDEIDFSACSAALAGAAVLNHAEVVSFLKDEYGRVIGARVRDTLSDKEDGLETVLEVPIPEEMFNNMGSNAALRWQNMQNLMTANRGGTDNKSSSSSSSSSQSCAVPRNDQLMLLLKLVGSALIPYQVQSDHTITLPVRDESIGGELCSLRYDLTVPFARYVAKEGLSSFRRYQIGKAYRRDNPSKGRWREFMQCDFDIAGQYEKMGPDFEVIWILTELLNELQIGDYEIKLNHRKLLEGMLAICGVPPDKFRTIGSCIDKLDKQPFTKIKKEMVEVKGLTEETADAIGAFVSKRGSPLDMLRELKKEGSKFLENAESALALNELEILFNVLDKSNCIQKIVFDLSLARGLDYYTGVIFEAVSKDFTEVGGSIGGGGRYDDLIGKFGKRQVPAVGVCLGIERILTIMEKLYPDLANCTTETEVFVSVLGDDLSLGAELVSKLWDADIKAEFAVNRREDKHSTRMAGIPWRVVVGEKDKKMKLVKLKDGKKEEVFDLPIDGFVEEVARRIKAGPAQPSGS